MQDRSAYESRMINELLKTDFSKRGVTTDDEFGASYGVFNVSNGYQRSQLEEMKRYYSEHRDEQMRTQDELLINQSVASQTMYAAWVRCLEITSKDNQFLNYRIENISGDDFNFSVTFKPTPLLRKPLLRISPPAVQPAIRCS